MTERRLLLDVPVHRRQDLDGFQSAADGTASDRADRPLAAAHVCVGGSFNTSAFHLF